ncbi:MAG: class I SAM-dependent methyltransferase [Lachnospiraceae bacterium]|nr:class I SAM-dependent methyltransferase [Lachnospiraceae bacterium]
MELSKRLQMIAQMVSEGNRLVDIGTDHGYIPIYLLQKGKIPTAIAMDIGEGPLKRAEDHIKAYCFESKAVCRLSNGFEKYRSGEADTAVIAGMGGDLMTKILNDGIEKLPDELILQPQSEWFKVRGFLMEHCYEIIQEEMLIEDGKYYVAIKAKKGVRYKLTELELIYGPLLLKQNHPVLKEYLQNGYHTMKGIFKHLMDVDTESANRRKAEIEKQIEQIKGAYAYYDQS